MHTSQAATSIIIALQVYKFERLQPLSYYAAAEQPPQKASLPWGAKAGKEQALADRCRMVRCLYLLPALDHATCWGPGS